MNVTGLFQDRRVQRFAVAGLLGGVVGYLCTTALDEPNLLWSKESVRGYYAVYFMLIIGGIGAWLIFTDARLRGARVESDLIARASVALVVLGLVAGYLGQVLFEMIVPDDSTLLCFDSDG